MSSEVVVKEPDEMGAWEEDESVIWLPRSLYPKRSDAVRWAIEQWSCHFLDVRCLSRWMQYTPEPHEYRDGEMEDRWSECEASDPGAFRVWRLECP